MIRAGAVVMLLASACATAGCVDDVGPSLVAVTPAAASPGAIVTLTGARLCAGDCETAGGAIRIGLDQPVQASIIDYTDTTAQVRIPTVTPVGRTVLVATVNERSSNTIEFEVLPP